MEQEGKIESKQPPSKTLKLGVSSALHVRLSIEKESRDLYVQWVFYVGSLISISNHNIHRDVGVSSFSTGSGNGWIRMDPYGAR
jgi:hypothetical protein